MDKSSPKSGLKRSLRSGLGLKSQPSQNLDKDRSSNIKGRVQNLILNFDKNMHEEPKKDPILPNLAKNIELLVT